MAKRRKSEYQAWLKALSGLFVNISAAWFVTPFIGLNLLNFDSWHDLGILIVDLLFAIVCLLITVWCEKRIK